MFRAIISRSKITSNVVQSPIQTKKQENKKKSSGRGWRRQGRGKSLTKFENG